MVRSIASETVRRPERFIGIPRRSLTTLGARQGGDTALGNLQMFPPYPAPTSHHRKQWLIRHCHVLLTNEHQLQNQGYP